MADLRRTQHIFGDGFIHETVDELWEDWMSRPTPCWEMRLCWPSFMRRCSGGIRTALPRSPQTEVVLRMLMLKHVRNWSLEEFER